MVGLVVDTGILLATHRQVQNAADAAALAISFERLSGKSDAAAINMAATMVQKQNGLNKAAITVTIPPTTGPYAGKSNYVEVLIDNPTNTWFIHAVGANSTQTVQGRAVAGLESISAPVAVASLDPLAVPGLLVDGVTLLASGRIAVNSQGTQNAATSPNNGAVQAPDIRVVGGVDVPASFQLLRSPSLPLSDPLLFLPTPTTANGVVNVYPGSDGQHFDTPQNVSIVVENNINVTLAPGVYSSIEIVGPGPGTVTFSPGIYVIKGGNANGRALHIETAGTIVGKDVMFYNTGRDFEVAGGLPDAEDGNTLKSDPTVFGSVVINAGRLTLTPLSSGSPLDGMLLYERRANTREMLIHTNNTEDLVEGTIYARWAEAFLAGPGRYNAQFITGSLRVGGTANTVNIASVGARARAKQVFLVE